MSEITCVLIFILIAIIVVIYLGYRYIEMTDKQLEERSTKNKMMTLFLLNKNLYAEYITWKNEYTATEFLSDISANTEKNDNNSTKDNTNE